MERRKEGVSKRGSSPRVKYFTTSSPYCAPQTAPIASKYYTLPSCAGDRLPEVLRSGRKQKNASGMFNNFWQRVSGINPVSKPCHIHSHSIALRSLLNHPSGQHQAYTTSRTETCHYTARRPIVLFPRNRSNYRRTSTSRGWRSW